MASIDSSVADLRSKDAKARAAALEALLAAGAAALGDAQLGAALAALPPLVRENNVKTAAAACDLSVQLCDVSGPPRAARRVARALLGRPSAPRSAPARAQHSCH